MTTVCCPSGAGDAALDRLQVFLPGAGDVRRQLQRGDARGQGLDPGPEQPGQGRGDRVQAGVVECGLPFPQVVHEQVADRLALQPVAVDEFLDGQLSLGHAERADGGRGAGGEDPEGVQAEVEVDLLLAAAGVDQPLGIGHLHAVPDGDAADGAALAGQDGRDPGVSEPGVCRDAAGPDSASSRSRANPAGSRTSAMTGARCLWARVTIQAMRGRITSPQMSISSPDDRSFSS